MQINLFFGAAIVFTFLVAMDTEVEALVKIFKLKKKLALGKASFLLKKKLALKSLAAKLLKKKLLLTHKHLHDHVSHLRSSFGELGGELGLGELGLGDLGLGGLVQNLGSDLDIGALLGGLLGGDAPSDGLDLGELVGGLLGGDDSDRKKRSIDDRDMIEVHEEQILDELLNKVFAEDTSQCFEQLICDIATRSTTTQLRPQEEGLLEMIRSDADKGFGFKRMEAAMLSGLGGSDCYVLFDYCPDNSLAMLDLLDTNSQNETVDNE